MTAPPATSSAWKRGPRHPRPSGPAREGEPGRPERPGRSTHSRIASRGDPDVQAVLSLRLVWANTAFLDEARTSSPGTLSRALAARRAAAVIRHLFLGCTGHLPAAGGAGREHRRPDGRPPAEPGFMLGATGLLWGTTSKLFGTRSAFFAAALFAVTGPTQALGAFATYDAMALFLLAASAWCVVSAQDRDNSSLFLTGRDFAPRPGQRHQVRDGGTGPRGGGPGRDHGGERRGLKPGLVRGGYLAAGTLGLVSALLALGGPCTWPVCCSRRSPGPREQIPRSSSSPTRRNGADSFACSPCWASSVPFAVMTGRNWPS